MLGFKLSTSTLMNATIHSITDGQTDSQIDRWCHDCQWPIILCRSTIG